MRDKFIINGIILISFLVLIGVTLQATKNVKKDINQATVEQLMEVKGIKEKEAYEIVNFIKAKKGIKSMDELSIALNLDPEVLKSLKKLFEVKH